MEYSDFLSHNNTVQSMKSAAASGQLSHAVLLHGPEGNGSLLAALELSKLLLCENVSEGAACNACPACLKVGKHIHPDIHYVFPVIKLKDKERDKEIYKDWYQEWRSAISKNPFLGYFDWISKLSGENKQGNISVKACQEVLRDLSLKAYAGDVKIGIFWLVEFLGKEGNRLLKLIEEPPANTYLFLITNTREALLSTIISRCQQVYLGPLPDEVIRAALESRHDVPQADADKIAMLAQGNWNEALNLMHEVSMHPLEMLKNWVRAAWNGNAAMISKQCEELQAMNREGQKQYLSYCLQFFEKLLWRLSGLVAENEYPAEKPILDFLVQKLDVEGLDSLRAICEDNLNSISFNVNQRIMWTDATIKLRDQLHAKEQMKAS
jgi:DNA polymerase-3 subunit delta'